MFDRPTTTPVPAGLIASEILSTIERERVLYAPSPIRLHMWPDPITLARGTDYEVLQ